MAEKKKYDSTVARIAGNIATGIVAGSDSPETLNMGRVAQAVTFSVFLARLIVAETERTEPEAAG